MPGALLAPGHIMKETGGSRPSPVVWRPKAALFQGSAVRRARMHWGCRALESNTWGTHSPGRYLLMSPLSFVCFHTGHLGCVVFLPKFFFRLRTYFRAPLSWPSFLLCFQSGISTQMASTGIKVCLQLKFKSCILEVRVFKLNMWVSMFLSREGHQTHILSWMNYLTFSTYYPT